MKKLIILLFLTTGFVCFQAHSQSSSPSVGTFSITDSASFKGKYKFENMPFEYIEISVQENKLYFVGGEYNGFLVPLTGKKDAFNVNDQAIFTFTRNSENKIAGLSVDYQGQIFQGKKEEKKN